MIIEPNDDLYRINRRVLKGTNYDWDTDIQYAVINNYDSIDITDGYTVTIHVNNVLSYRLSCNDAKQYLKSFLKSEIREQKLNQIL